MLEMKFNSQASNYTVVTWNKHINQTEMSRSSSHSLLLLQMQRGSHLNASHKTNPPAIDSDRFFFVTDSTFFFVLTYSMCPVLLFDFQSESQSCARACAHRII